MISQVNSNQHVMYCKLIPQRSYANNCMTYLLELLPCPELQTHPQSMMSETESRRNVQPVQKQFANFGCQRFFTSFCKEKVIRKKVELDQNAIKFKERFYSFFTYKKRIPKDLVFNIHNNIAKEINLRCVTREECRSVDKYFRNFAKNQKEIINYLSSLSVEQRNQLQIRKHPFINIENAQ